MPRPSPARGEVTLQSARSEICASGISSAMLQLKWPANVVIERSPDGAFRTAHSCDWPCITASKPSGAPDLGSAAFTVRPGWLVLLSTAVSAWTGPRGSTPPPHDPDFRLDPRCQMVVYEPCFKIAVEREGGSRWVHRRGTDLGQIQFVSANPIRIWVIPFRPAFAGAISERASRRQSSSIDALAGRLAVEVAGR